MAGSIKLAGKYAEKAEKMLSVVTTILEQEKIPYTLEGGTLLGIVREKRLLPWDNDIDLTITRPYVNQLLSIRWKLWLRGYRTRVRTIKADSVYFKKDHPRILKIQTTRFLFFKGVSLMDIFIKDLKEDRYYWTVSEKEVLKSTARTYYENLANIEFKGKLYSVPEKYEDYLQSRYGDWKTPVKDYDYTKDDLSILNKK